MMAPRSLSLELLSDTFAVCRFAAHEPVPAWALLPATFTSISRSEHELSIVCPESAVPLAQVAERGYRAMRVRGPLPFHATGILESIARPLAEASIPNLAIANHDPDDILVRSRDLASAMEVLREAGHTWPAVAQGIAPA